MESSFGSIVAVFLLLLYVDLSRQFCFRIPPNNVTDTTAEEEYGFHFNSKGGKMFVL